MNHKTILLMMCSDVFTRKSPTIPFLKQNNGISKNGKYFFFQKMIAAAYLVLSITILISQTQGAQLPECTSNGFFRHPDDCTRFYRCVDLTGRGYFQTYTFSCPVGTVFDETVSVCNHPWAAPPCEEAEAETTTKMEEIFEETDEDSEDVRHFILKFRVLLLVSVLISNSIPNFSMSFWILTFHKHSAIAKFNY